MEFLVGFLPLEEQSPQEVVQSPNPVSGILPMLNVACLPSHPLDKLVARKKRRGREASLPPVVEVLGATLIQKVTDGSRLYPQMYKVDRCLADPLLPIRVGLTQKS
ncbi:hypothetical protein RYX36_021566, partial [Vicia faba]